MLLESLRLLLNLGRQGRDEVVRLEKRIDENAARIAQSERELERLDRHVELFEALNRKRVEEEERNAFR